VTAKGQLSLSLLKSAEFNSAVVERPSEEMLRLPERAIQFGTGGFLRGFVEYFIDSANRAGTFNGRVVAVASTSSPRNNLVNDQDGLYTLVVEGMRDGQASREFRIVSSLSRALSAATEWDEVLRLARDSNIEIVFSNTTEVGIVLDEPDEPDSHRDRFPGSSRCGCWSAPARLTLHPEIRDCDSLRARRAERRPASRDRDDTGRSLVGGDEFQKWLDSSVVFCNTLVDRIVPGNRATRNWRSSRRSSVIAMSC
jgi:tagaturonate reductase